MDKNSGFGFRFQTNQGESDDEDGDIGSPSMRKKMQSSRRSVALKMFIKSFNYQVENYFK